MVNPERNRLWLVSLNASHTSILAVLQKSCNVDQVLQAMQEVYIILSGTLFELCLPEPENHSAYTSQSDS